MFVFGELTYDVSVKEMVVAAAVTVVDIQDVYNNSVEWASEPANMIYDTPVTGGGKFALNDPPTKFTGLVVRMDTVSTPPGGGANWRLKFPDAGGPSIERRTVEGGDFIAAGAGDPLQNSANIMPVIELSTSPTLVIASGGLTEADKDDIAGRVWDRLLSAHLIAGSFGNYIQKKLLTFSKWFALK